MIHDVTSLIKDNEGFSLKLYKDTVGLQTIGYGRCIELIGISEEEANFLLTHDILDAQNALIAEYPWFANLDPVREAALIDLRFNLGNRLREFKKFLTAMSKSDWSSASNELVASKWYGQVKRRGSRIAEMILTGRWPS